MPEVVENTGDISLLKVRIRKWLYKALPLYQVIDLISLKVLRLVRISAEGLCEENIVA